MKKKVLIISLIVVFLFTGCSKEQGENKEQVIENAIESEETEETLDQEDINEESNEEISIDQREMISGLFDGQFPEIIVSQNIEQNTVSKETFFVIEVSENPSTGYFWEIEEQENIELLETAFKSEAEENQIGVGGKRYFGLKINNTGEYSIKLILKSPAGEKEESKIFDIVVK